MSQNVGRLTLALALIVMGAALIIDNIWSTETAVYAGRLWPALLMLLGLEWIWASQRLQEGLKVKVDPAALVMLGVVALGIAAWSDAKLSAKWAREWVGSAGPHVQFQMPPRMEVRTPHIVIQPPLFGSVSADRESTYDQTSSDLKRVEISDSSAKMDVRSGERFKVTLKVTAYGTSQAEAEENVRSLQLKVSESGGTARVNVDRARNLSRYSMEYEVEVPKGVDLVVRSSSGSVTVEGLEGSVDITASSGAVRIRDIQGNVVATTSSGSMELEQISGSLKANANSGSIVVEDVGGALWAQASSGTITVNTDKVGGAYDLTASSGSVRLSVPDSANIAVQANASSGMVSGPRWLAIGERRNSGSGTLGSGEFKVTIRTSSGSIQVDDD